MTQKDIALKLNVSQATVSMALKGSPRISQALRDSVRKLVDDCGYRPNLAGQLLRRGRSNIIGAVFPSLRHGFHAELFQELQRQLLPQGYLLYLCCAESREELVSVAGYLKQLQVAGVVAIGSAAEVLLPLREAGIALVFYGGGSPSSGPRIRTNRASAVIAPRWRKPESGWIRRWCSSPPTRWGTGTG